MPYKVHKTPQAWQQLLDKQTYHITQEGGTERAFTGCYWDHHAKGVYRCACCSNTLFASTTKFDSGSGWPSYWQPVQEDAIEKHADHKLGMKRTEVRCSHCGAHLGHVFDDGPPPTGLRYCINSAALIFEAST